MKGHAMDKEKKQKLQRRKELYAKALEKTRRLVEKQVGRSLHVEVLKVTRVKAYPYTYNWQDGKTLEVEKFDIEGGSAVYTKNAEETGSTYIGTVEIKSSSIGAYSLALRSILSLPVGGDRDFSDFDHDELIGKKFVAILRTEQWNEWFETKRRVESRTYIYRILPYIPYVQYWLNKEKYKDRLQTQKKRLKRTIEIYKGYPKGGL